MKYVEPVEEPPFPDPQEEVAPDDLYACGLCGGIGSIRGVWNSPSGRYDEDECPACLGSGVLL